MVSHRVYFLLNLADYGVDKYDIGTGFGHFGIAVEDVRVCFFNYERLHNWLFTIYTVVLLKKYVMSFLFELLWAFLFFNVNVTHMFF